MQPSGADAMTTNMTREGTSGELELYPVDIRKFFCRATPGKDQFLVYEAEDGQVNIDVCLESE
jgi:hypothetical protein